MKEFLWQLTATEVVGLLKAEKVTPVDCLDCLEQKIRDTDHFVHAIPILGFERARAAAVKLMKQGFPVSPPPGYLYGLPVLIKDMNAVAGLPFTQGFAPFGKRIATTSDKMVLQIEERGGIVYGKSNVPEFGAGSQTFNGLFETCKSPFDTRVTAGGSSGGAAASLASGTSWLASGSDLGGSLRIPASFTGTVGFRATPGLIVDDGKTRAQGRSSSPFISLHAVNGPMGRTVADVALFMDTLRAPSGSWGFEPSLPPKTSLVTNYKSFQEAALSRVCPRKIAFSSDLGLGPSVCPTDPEIVRICEQAAQWFTTQGAECVRAEPEMKESLRIFQNQRALHFAQLFGPWLDTEIGSQLKPEIQWNVRAGLDLQAKSRSEKSRPATIEEEELALHAQFVAKIERWFETENIDLLLTPAVMCAPFDICTRYVKGFRGAKFNHYMGWMVLSWSVTVTQCPALVLPCGLTTSGLPVGLQIIGRSHDDGAVLSAARLFEQAHFYHRHIPLAPRKCSVPLQSVDGVSTAIEAQQHHLHSHL